MNKMLFIIITFIAAGLSAEAAKNNSAPDHTPVKYERAELTAEMRISRGGQLYDNWWKATADTIKPEDNHPLWKLQNKNKRQGYSTYRCKECHGWDYRGKDGAYGKGSHYTGFGGVYEASQKMSSKELEDILKGSTNKDHNFSAYLSDYDISDLALFMKNGSIDLLVLLNSDGDYDEGLNFYRTNCMTECHGPTGTALNFGSDEKPQFIGTVANKNPWEFIHKVRAGQPGTKMSSGIINAWNPDNLRNLLAYAKTLPTEKPKVDWFDSMLNRIGLGAKEQISYTAEEHRGFGPKIEQ